MPFINFSDSLTVLLGLVLFVLTLFLGKETHKSAIPAAMLGVFLVILVIHVAELMLIADMTD